MRQRREVVEHPFGTIKLRMGATHFLMKRLPKVRGEMALHVLAYNLNRVQNILGIQPLMAALKAEAGLCSCHHVLEVPNTRLRADGSLLPPIINQLALTGVVEAL
jgi:hypothetical protein